jgi:hypothetical protein
MRPHTTQLERAFVLAASGQVQTVSEVRRLLRREGYSTDQIEGPLLIDQLQNLIENAHRPKIAEHPAASDRDQPDKGDTELTLYELRRFARSLGFNIQRSSVKGRYRLLNPEGAYVLNPATRRPLFSKDSAIRYLTSPDAKTPREIHRQVSPQLS